MEDGKTGPYRPFLPLDSSSPLKDEEEVAYRQDQAAGLVASRYFLVIAIFLHLQ